MKNKNFIPSFGKWVVLYFFGCNIAGHLDELSVMGKYSREKDDQHKLVQGY